MRLKRLISSFVMCAMLVTLMPMQAFAVDDAGEATTWTKELSVDELYHAVQDQLDENNAIALEDLTAIEAIASDVRDDVTGQLTAIAFDDQQVVLAELDDTTSYTLTFAEEDNADAAPAEPDAQPSVESDAGEPVTVPSEPAANNTPTENPQTTGPPAEPEVQSDVSLTVTEKEIFTTEAKAEEQAQKQGVDPAAVSTETSEDGQVLGATLTVNEVEVSKVTLTYEAEAETEEDPFADFTVVEDTESYTEFTPSMLEEMGVSLSDMLEAQELAELLGNQGNAAIEVNGTAYAFEADSALTLAVDWENGQFTYEGQDAVLLVDLGIAVLGLYDGDTFKHNDNDYVPNNAIPEGNSSDAEVVVDVNKTATPSTTPGQWDITLTANVKQELTPQKQEVVLLIDTSGSMAWCTHGTHDHSYNLGGFWCGYTGESEETDSRLAKTKEVAKELIQTLAQRGLNVSVAVTSFNMRGYSNCDLVSLSDQDTVNSLEGAIDDLYAGGSTQMLSGLKTAGQAFSNEPTKKTIIMLADGDNDSNKQNTKEAAKKLRDANVAIYTVGFMADNNTLQDIAGSDDHYFTANNASELSDVFDTIANQLTAMINDPLGDDVSLVGNVQVTATGLDENDYEAKYDPENNLITWNPTDTDTTIGAEAAITLTYTVKVDDPDVGVNNVDLNGDATFNYFYTKNGTPVSGSASYPTPQGTYSAGRLNQEFQTTEGDTISEPITGELQYLSWGAGGETQSDVTEFTWDAPDDTIENGGKTYYYQYSYLADDSSKAPLEDLSVDAEAKEVTIIHAYAEQKPQYSVEYSWGGKAVDGETLPTTVSYEAEATVLVHQFETAVYGTENGQTYKFTGWSVTPNTVEIDSNHQFTMPAEHVILTAQWQRVYTVDEVLAKFQKKVETAQNSTLPTDLNETFNFTLNQDNEEIAKATATVTSSEPVTLTSAANGSTKLNDGTYTLTEDDVTAVGWSKDATTYTIQITGGQITVAGGTAGGTVDASGKYLFTNIYNQPKATLTVQAVDEEGNVLSAEGWPESVELPIGASYHITVGTPIGTEDVNVSNEITTTEGDHYVYVDPKDGSELTGQITNDVIVTLVYGLDNIGTEGPDVPDGVLDKYQVLVEFISADESTGTVGGQTQKVYTKIGFVNPSPTENGYINVSADGVTITPEEGYVFAYWTKDDETKETTLPKNGLYVTSDVEKIVFKAHFGEDKIGEKDPNEGDGIADVFQVLVNFEVKNGSWNDGTSDTVQKVFTRKSSGKLSLTGTYTLQDADWPSVGQKPAQGFKAAGSWYEGEYELSLPVKLTQNSLSERTFTFIYEPLGEYELWIEHRYLGGPLDNDRSYPYYDSTNDFGEQFYSTRFDSSEELVLAGTTIQLQELLSDKMDAGYKYGTYDFVTAPGVEDLKINESNPSWEMPEGWMKLVILYVSRTDLSYTVNYLDADTNEPIQDAKTVSNQTYGTEITSADEVVNVPGYTFNHADKDALTITAVAENNVINLYYKKASYTVTYQWENDLHPESAVLPSESTYKMGDPVGIDTTYTIGQVVKDNSGTYRFAGWSVADISVVDGQFVMPARDVTIIGAWVPMIEVTPADITIYTGGDGYTGAVNGSEALTDSGLPEPGFYVTLPEALDKALKAAVGHVGNGPLDLSGYVTITAKASDGNSRSWKLERYDNQPDHESMAYGKYIYRIVPTVEGQDPVRVQFTDDQGNVIRDDEFDIKLDTLYQKYDMSIYPGRVNENTVKITVNANKETGNVQAECAVDSRTGELTVRGIVNAIKTDIVNAVPENAANITAIADAGTEYYINGSKLEVADGHKVKLLVDEIVDDAQSALKKAIIASSDNDIDEDFEFRFKYLDLVDTSNGNVWITPSKPMTVFWPYPKGTDEDTEFQVIHFDGLDRNYDNLETELQENSPEYLNVTHVAGGITFTVDSFSPFALVWEADDDNGGGGAHHPDAGDGDDDDDDDEEEIIDEEVPLAETPWLNTEDHYAYIIGYAEDGTVRPNANITRAEVATIFFRLLTDEARDQFWMTTNNFSDVLPNDWYNNAVSTMVNAGIIQGYEDGTFRPNNNITRAEFAAIASRFMSSGYDVEEDLFTDIANHWARENINDAAMAGWINGYPGGIFLPDQAITRAEAVTLVNNVLQRKPDADHMLDSMIKWPDNPEGAWYYEAIQEATNSHDYDLFEDAEYEIWTALQPNRDWAAIEKGWLDAHSA